MWLMFDKHQQKLEILNINPGHDGMVKKSSHATVPLNAWFSFMATLNNKNGKRTYCHPWKGLLGIEIQLNGTMSQGFDLRILILCKTGAPLSQIIAFSIAYFFLKSRSYAQLQALTVSATPARKNQTFEEGRIFCSERISFCCLHLRNSWFSFRFVSI
jgi:hypothetical protein